MNALVKILIALLLAVLVACVVSPWAYAIGQALAEVIPAAGGFPFHRYFSRSVQVCTILVAIPLIFWIGVRSVRELGLEKNPRAVGDLLVGIVAALGPTILVGVAYVSLDIFRIRNEHALSPLFRILLTAGVVALIEEFLFRGVLLGLAVRSVGRFWGIVIASVAFALVHFVRPAKTAVDDVTWVSGFRQAMVSLENMPPWPLLGYGFATLFVAGVLLAWLTLRTRSLWIAIGVHAGWIVGQQGLSWMAKFRAKPPDEFLPWVGPSLVSGAVPTGLVALGALGVTTLLLFVYLRYGRRIVRV